MSLFTELKRRNVIRVAIAYIAGAWLLTEVSGTLFPAFGIPDWGVRFVVIVLALGFFPALIISWAYELTPEGLKREKDVVRDQSHSHLTSKRLDGIAIALMVLVVAFILADRFWLSPRFEQRTEVPATAKTESVQSSNHKPIQPQAKFKSIAVLPFADMSEGQDQSWFADGLAEEILNTLVRTPDLKVSSRTSSFAYKGTQTPIAQIASDLNVAHVLEGSVRRSGDRIRVTAQLIRADDGFHVWSEQFDREIENVISIQEDLALNIAKALKTTMDPVALKEMLQAGTRSVKAYEHYLNGLATITRLWESSDSSLVTDALKHFENASEADPGFAAAHAASARMWQSRFTTARFRLRQKISFQQAFANYQKAMQKAIEYAPDETQKMLYRAELATIELRGADAVRLLRRVLEKLPNNYAATAALWRAAIYSMDSDAETLALENFLRLGDIQSLETYITAARRFVPSKQHVAKILELVERFPNTRSIIYQAHRTLLWAGERKEAYKLYPRLVGEERVSNRYVRARQACSLGDRDEVEQVLQTAQKEGSSRTFKWHILVLLGEREKAVQILKPYESKEVPIMLGSWLSYQQFDPRPFPALMAVLKREGLDWPPPRDIPFACPPKEEL
jgi:TolB-like protein